MAHTAPSGELGDRRIGYLEKHLARFDVVWPNEELVEISADLRSKTRAIGRELKVADAWIAATAVMLKCPLISHDRDFTAVEEVYDMKHITHSG